MSHREADDKLLRMAEQIAANLGAGSDPQQAAQRTAAHLKRFWTPAMITKLLQLASQDEAALSPATRLAAQALSGEQAAG